MRLKVVSLYDRRDRALLASLAPWELIACRDRYGLVPPASGQPS